MVTFADHLGLLCFLSMYKKNSDGLFSVRVLYRSCYIRIEREIVISISQWWIQGGVLGFWLALAIPIISVADLEDSWGSKTPFWSACWSYLMKFS